MKFIDLWPCDQGWTLETTATHGKDLLALPGEYMNPSGWVEPLQPSVALGPGISNVFFTAVRTSSSLGKDVTFTLNIDLVKGAEKRNLLANGAVVVRAKDQVAVFQLFVH